MKADAFCFAEAGSLYNISPLVLWSIAKVESTFRPDAVNYNTNGTVDVGLMQINSLWAATIGRDAWQSLGDPCYNVKVGAWILSNCIKDYGYNWRAIGCYHSRTPSKRDAYAQKIFRAVDAATRQQSSLPDVVASSVN